MTTAKMSEYAELIRVGLKDLSNLKKEFDSIEADCGSRNWDGYNATPISHNALRSAWDYASSLPEEIPIPEVTPEPDGEIALEWYGKDGSVFSISFGEGETISYAGLI